MPSPSIINLEAPSTGSLFNKYQIDFDVAGIPSVIYYGGTPYAPNQFHNDLIDISVIFTNGSDPTHASWSVPGVVLITYFSEADASACVDEGRLRPDGISGTTDLLFNKIYF